MNPYEPPETRESSPKPRAKWKTWPLIFMNLAFLLSAGLVVALPNRLSWLGVSVLICLSIGGWALAKNLQQTGSSE
ncbi:hypothetical protein [Planctomycetes bacterium K23_9]|uniref:Uncharacterized protein n=1 Tax=Stieleria marina TaxID=1930275 RepID=A0A517NMT7_9BACT|nr:hypothetical protein K239x_03850 [Planctomycetes bacterium K23_9]